MSTNNKDDDDDNGRQEKEKGKKKGNLSIFSVFGLLFKKLNASANRQVHSC